MRSDSIDKERFVLGLVLSVNMWIFFCDCWCVSDGEGRKIENMVSRMR